MKRSLPKPDVSIVEKTKNKKIKPEKMTFSECYKENSNWMDYPEINVLETLKSFYPHYYKRDIVQYGLLRKDIIENKRSRKPNEFFKSLFKLPYVLDKPIVNDRLQTIVRKFGSQIVAHGVEESKGGMYNLLLMSVSNQVRSCSSHWGRLVNGMPNISPLPHGPYYLIYNMPALKVPNAPNNPKFSDIARVLVPFKENCDVLKEKLEAMVQVELITTEMQDSFIKKTISYDDFLVELKQLESKNRFFGSTEFCLEDHISNEKDTDKCTF